MPKKTDEELNLIGIGYTLATGKMYCDSMSHFHEFAEELMGGPIYTHEFASKTTWERLRRAFELKTKARLNA